MEKKKQGNRYNKKVTIAIILALLLVIIAVITMLFNPSNKVLKGNSKKTEKDMTKGELEQSLKQLVTTIHKKQDWSGLEGEPIVFYSLRDLKDLYKQDVSKYDVYKCDVDNTYVSVKMAEKEEYKVQLSCENIKK